METFTGTNGVTYTKQGDGTWKGGNGSTLSSDNAARALGYGASGADDGKVIIRAFNDGSQRRSTDGGATWTIIDPAPAKATEPDQNLGAGVFADARGYYVLDKTGSSPTDVQKRYITEAEAKRATSLPGGSSSDANAAGNLSARYAELGQRQYEFGEELALKAQELDEQIANNARQAEIERQKQAFYQQQSLFERTIGNARIALDKQGLALQAAGLAQDYDLSVATMQQQREIVNAQMQQATSEFNASMGFQVEQANVADRARRQEQTQQYSRDIAGYSADPGDRAALASYVMANTGFGQAADTEGVDLITDESLTPLELALRNRNDIMAQPDNPYSFTPTTAPQLGAMQLPARPTVPTTITPTTIPPVESKGIQSPAVEAAAQQGVATAADKSGALWEMVDGQWTQYTPRMEEGGVVKGAFIAGDSSDGKENQEVIIPDFPAPGMTTVVPKGKLTPKMKAHMGKMAKMQDGGVFASGPLTGLGSDRTLARGYQSEVARRSAQGTPFENYVPDVTFEATPGFDPMVASLVQGIRSASQGLPMAWQQRQAALLTPPGLREGVVGRTR